MVLNHQARTIYRDLSVLLETSMSDSPNSNSTPPPLSPWRCVGGGIAAGAIAVAMYFLTTAIAASFASKGLHSDNLLVQRITAAVRTMFIGMSALGTGIFGLAAVGLMGLAIQLTVQKGQSSSIDS